MDYGRLPVTGVGIAIGGVVLDQMWLVAIAFGAVIAGAVLIRLGWRRNKSMTDA